MKVILASASPRRSDILRRMGIPFTVQAASVEAEAEGKALVRSYGGKPEEYVQYLSMQKALAVAATVAEDGLVIGADTVVSLDGEILEKPANVQEAISMITRIQGRAHDVYTGVAAVGTGALGEHRISFAEGVKVHVFPMRPEQIREYATREDVLDKAGAYGIQGRFGLFIEKIEGDYNTVVGLPVARLYQECLGRGLRL